MASETQPHESAGHDHHSQPEPPSPSRCRDSARHRRRRAAFKNLAASYSRPQIAGFIKRNDSTLLAEFAADQATPGGLPDHWSNGAAELALRHITDAIDRRAFTLRNAERTNRLLELFRLHENRWDDVGTYSAAIREHLHTVGKPARQLTVKDPAGQPSLR